MSSEENAPCGPVADGPIDLRRIPARAQLLFTFSADLTEGRRVSFGPSQLALLIQVSTKQVIKTFREQVDVAYQTATSPFRAFPCCIVEVWGCAYRHDIYMGQGPFVGSGQHSDQLLPALPPLPWYAYLDIEHAFGVRGLSASAIPPYQNLHRQRWDSLRPKPNANDW